MQFGFITKELVLHLVFDDSDGQLRLQLATTHAATQLNLGHLIHQSDNYRGSSRGEGFELRTDQWGAVRGEHGLWIIATANEAEAPAGEHVAALALLRQASQLAGSFNEMATTHQTVRLAAYQGATAANSSRLMEDQAPSGGTAGKRGNRGDRCRVRRRH